MKKLPVDLSSHLNKTTEYGEVDFDIAIRPSLPFKKDDVNISMSPTDLPSCGRTPARRSAL